MKKIGRLGKSTAMLSIAVLTLSLNQAASNSAYAAEEAKDCKQHWTTIEQQQKLIEQNTGNRPVTAKEAKDNQYVKQQEKNYEAAKKDECGAPFSLTKKPYSPATGNVHGSENTPLAPGELGIPSIKGFFGDAEKSSKDREKDKGKKDKDDNMFPIIQPRPPVQGPSYPYSGGNTQGGNGGSQSTQKQCGKVAGTTAGLVDKLSGKDLPKYKEGCAGIDAAGKPVTSNSKTPESACEGLSFDSYGFVKYLFNNENQTVDVNYLSQTIPDSQTKDTQDVVIFKNNGNGQSKEPEGCRLTSFTCGKEGDIIMIQTDPYAPQNRPYNKFMLYSGGNFYEAQNDPANPIYKGPMKPEYVGRSYEVRRLACARDPEKKEEKDKDQQQQGQTPSTPNQGIAVGEPNPNQPDKDKKE